MNLELPPARKRFVPFGEMDVKYFSPTLVALHTLAENLRMQIHFHKDLLKLAPVICRIAQHIRPGWAEYWHRLCPEIEPTWRRRDIGKILSFYVAGANLFFTSRSRTY